MTTVVETLTLGGEIVKELYSTVGLANECVKTVKKGLNHESTAQNFKSTTNELCSILDRMELLAGKMDLLGQVDIIKRTRKELQEACRKYTKITWWNFFLAPSYHDKLVETEKSIKESMSFWMAVQMWMKPSPYPTGHPESTVELNVELMRKVKSFLMEDGGDRVFYLRGFAGSGKTTLAKQIRDDTDVQGRFSNNILIKHVGSKFESNKQLIDELHKNRREAVLLVLDNVELGSEQLVQQCRKQISFNPTSKILVISRVHEIQSLGTPDPQTGTMEPLGKGEAETLLRQFVQPGRHDKSLQQVVSSCGRYPIEIKLIGTQLGKEPIEYWLKMLQQWQMLKQWRPQGRDSSHDTSTELFSRLQYFLSVWENFQSISEFFMDLGLFAKDEMIPVTALIDMWVELCPQFKDDELEAMLRIRKLEEMNLAEMVVTRRIGREDDNYYNDHFLKQHEVLRELAIHMMSREPLETRRRLIIDMNGNHRPQWWPQINQLKAAASILSMSIDQNITSDWCNIQESDAVVLVLNLVTTDYTLPEFIKNMKNLKVLIVTNYGSRPSKLRNLEVLDSLQSLKRIRLQDVSMPSLCNLKNVHKLSFSNCEVKKAFEDSSFEFSKAMPNLAVLNIEWCEDLVEFPVGFCDIVTLKKLNITSCSEFTEIPEEIGKLKKLEFLWITCCPEFENMPVSITKLECLSSLNISYCESLRKLPENIGELTSLEKFYWESCPELTLPASLKGMKHLEIYPPVEGI